MSGFVALALVATPVLLVAVSAVDVESGECPTWHYRSSENQSCVRGFILNGAMMWYGEDKLYLRVDYCMTWNNSTHEYAAGPCHRGYSKHSTVDSKVFLLLSKDPEHLNERQCGDYHREGLLCSRCIDGFSLHFSSFVPTCFNCTHFSPASALLLYLAFDLIPITIFFALILIFRINVTSGPMLGYFIFCQIHAIIVGQLNNFYAAMLADLSTFGRYSLQMSLFMSSAWTWNFLHEYPSFCVSPKLGVLNTLILNYVSVVYPIVLVFFTYIAFELHAQNFRPVVVIWKPFHKCFHKVRRNWNAGDSIVHAYATLLLLSFAALNYTTYNLLNSIDIYTPNGKHTESRKVLISDPYIEQYSRQHLPYAATAVVLLFLLGFCPALLLCLHPFRVFRQAIQKCFSPQKRIILNTFVETMQGFCKDGLNGTRDFRLLPTIAMFVAMFANLCAAHGNSLFNFDMCIVGGTLSILISIAIAYVRPCKSALANISLSFHLVLVGTLTLFLVMWILDGTFALHKLSLIFPILLPIPHVLMLLWFGYKMASRFSLLRSVFSCVVMSLRQTECSRCCINENNDLLPDRLVNSQEYHHLPLPTC